MQVETTFDATAILDSEKNENINSDQAITNDLGNLLVNSHEILEGETTIETATRLAQELIGHIFVLPVEKSDVGPLAILPHPVYPIPREKHVRYF